MRLRFAILTVLPTCLLCLNGCDPAVADGEAVETTDQELYVASSKLWREADPIGDRNGDGIADLIGLPPAACARRI